MGLSQDELIELSDDVIALWRKIQEIKSSQSAGGKKITKKEGRALLRVVVQLAAAIALDIMD